MLVLIVDGGDDDGESLAGLLERSGLAAVAVEGDHAALDVLGTIRPGCVVLNCHRPDGGRLHVLERIRGHDDLADVPVVVYAAHDDPDTRRQAWALGVTGWVSKHDGPHHLLDTLFTLQA